MLKRLLLVITVIFLFHGVCLADILIIANKGVRVSSLSKDNIRDIFLGARTKWENNKPIQFVLNGKKSVLKEFIKTYTHKTPSQFKAHWKNMVFTGKGDQPKKFDSSQALLQYVEKNDGVISFIDSETNAENVKIIPIRKGGK